MRTTNPVPPGTVEPTPDLPAVVPDTAEALPLQELLRRSAPPVPEIGGRKDGPDPTRYGDWEKNGRCIDF